MTEYERVNEEANSKERRLSASSESGLSRSTGSNASAPYMFNCVRKHGDDG